MLPVPNTENTLVKGLVTAATGSDAAIARAATIRGGFMVFRSDESRNLLHQTCREPGMIVGVADLHAVEQGGAFVRKLLHQQVEEHLADGAAAEVRVHADARKPAPAAPLLVDRAGEADDMIIIGRGQDGPGA